GGYFERGAIVVTTYASAFRFMEQQGNQFGLIIFDECHHLPGSAFRYAAEMAIAPFRLGLTATPERSDGADPMLEELIGKIMYRKEARDLAGEYLADYTTARVMVHLSDKERAQYDAERLVFQRFLHEQNINMRSPNGWQRFLIAAARSEAGRRAM